MTTKLAKGQLVRLNVYTCFTEAQGGGRDYPLSNFANDKKGIVEGKRPTSVEEKDAWYKSDASKGFDSAGESKLPPQTQIVKLYRDRVYQVLRARCQVRLGYGNPVGGMAMILCTHTGQEAYVKRGCLEPIIAE